MKSILKLLKILLNPFNTKEKTCSLSFMSGLVLLGLSLVGCQVPVTKIAPTNPKVEVASTKTPGPTYTLEIAEFPTFTLTFSPSPTDTHTPTPTTPNISTLSPGATHIFPIDGMVLVYVPAGEFLMGSTEVDQGADYDEMPQHSVYLDAFWMDRTVVTNAMFAVFLNALGNQIEARTTWLDAGDEDVLIIQQAGVWQAVEGYENYPAVEVSWYGAQAYCHWAGRRLPSEAEWERAARGMDGRVYPWGDEIDCDHAEYANCSGGLLPISSNPLGASPYGVLGLSGNTWEWVADWYADGYYSDLPSENPFGPLDGGTRVLRGGSWEYDWKHLRSANRRHNGPAVSMHDYGFRCVLSAETH